MKHLTPEAYAIIKARNPISEAQDQYRRNRRDDVFRHMFGGGGTEQARSASLPPSQSTVHPHYQMGHTFDAWHADVAQRGKAWADRINATYIAGGSDSLHTYLGHLHNDHSGLAWKAEAEDKNPALTSFHAEKRNVYKNIREYHRLEGKGLPQDRSDALTAAKHHFNSVKVNQHGALEHHKANPDWHKTDDIGDPTKHEHLAK